MGEVDPVPTLTAWDAAEEVVVVVRVGNMLGTKLACFYS
jgi:hypothetical protein